MPGLLSLRENFFLLSSEEKIQFIRTYRTRRAADLAKPATFGASKPKAANAKYTALGLSPEQIQTCKDLGLKPKDIIALKEQVHSK